MAPPRREDALDGMGIPLAEGAIAFRKHDKPPRRWRGVPLGEATADSMEDRTVGRLRPDVIQGRSAGERLEFLEELIVSPELSKSRQEGRMGAGAPFREFPQIAARDGPTHLPDRAEAS